MNKLFYPALFHKAEEGGFWVTFPDFPDCFTQGESIDEAYEMATSALGLCITDLINDHQSLPAASEPSAIISDSDTTLVIISFDLDEYRRKNNSKSVKKTLTIPEWLNEAATQMNVNFSQVLQDALLSIVNH